MTAYERLIDALRDNGSNVNGANAQCPAHDDGRASLSIKPIDGSVLVYCHAGCDTADVLAALSLTMADLYDDRKGATYEYPGGRRVHRKPDKTFPQSGNKSDRSLFHGDRIGDAKTVYIPEGEKDVLAIESVGGVAVCSAMGAGKAHLADWPPLKGKTAIIVADDDKPGREHAAKIADLLDGIAASVVIKQAAVGKDVADHIAAGKTLDELVDADWWKPYDSARAPQSQDVAQFFDRDGLRARDLAETVMQSITCGYGEIDERIYVYENGVWAPNNGRVEAEIARLLGNRYRNTHCRNTIDLIRYSPQTARITRDPLPRYINVRNGMVDWADGALLPHSPDYCSTVQLPVDYDRSATCPEFDRFLADVLAQDAYQPVGDSPGFIWELIGYALYSGNPLHIAVLLYGKGRNGKGTLIRVLKSILGNRNCSTVGLHELTENRFRTATLFGKLANLAGDLDSRWLNNTAMFKAITGGDTIQGEHKYGAVFDFQPWALPFYSTNKAFGAADSSEGWVARWVVVPFPMSFVGREDRQLDTRLQSGAELRGILRRGIEALPALMRRGRLPEPESVRDAKAAFVAASDAVRSWIGERCTLDPHSWTPRTNLYRAYSDHSEDDGAKRLSAREFYNRIEQVNNIWPATRQGTRGFTGVRLGAEGAEGAGSPTSNHAHGGKGRKPAPSAPYAPSSDDRSAANAAYINGLCRDCHTKPYSAGRPRCDECHRIWLITVDGYER